MTINVRVNYSQVSSSMKDLCFDVYGIEKEKKDPREVKGNRGRCHYYICI